MKKTILLLLLSSIVLFGSCNKNTKTDVLTGKTFTAIGEMGETETFSFKKNGIATYRMEFDGLENTVLETWYDYHINEETEEIVLNVTKYPYLDEQENYSALTLDELIKKDPEGEADYKKIFEKTLSYKYLLMPSKLIMMNKDWMLMK